ncbi:hypothetical protein [Anaerolentibacter hominis]|uniref:hypothetical protein n=1 Tax=Anaerolentibacter hominis TaxID=3079009 RepID=UPI0031B82DE6
MKAKDIAQIGLMTGVMIAGKEALAFLPNIELVTLFVILFTLVLKGKVLFVIYTFVAVEGLLYGFGGTWWVVYLYIWPLLAGITWLCRKNTSAVLWAVLAGAFGMAFGALSAIPYFFIGGAGMAAAYWVSGIPFDVMHCVSNFILTLVLFKPMYKVIEKL